MRWQDFIMAATSNKNFHLPLPEDIYTALRREASRLQQPATRVARHAIQQWLKAREKAELHLAIASYAEEHAESDVDFDAVLEAATTEYLNSTV